MRYAIAGVWCLFWLSLAVCWLLPSSHESKAQGNAPEIWEISDAFAMYYHEDGSNPNFQAGNYIGGTARVMAPAGENYELWLFADVGEIGTDPSLVYIDHYMDTSPTSNGFRIVLADEGPTSNVTPALFYDCWYFLYDGNGNLKDGWFTQAFLAMAPRNESERYAEAD